MCHTELRPDLIKFVASLKRLEGFLCENGPEFWAQKITKVRQVAEKSDGYCIELFLGMFGGMGSFNDLALNASPSINDEFYAERSWAFDLTQALK